MNQERSKRGRVRKKIALFSHPCSFRSFAPDLIFLSRDRKRDVPKMQFRITENKDPRLRGINKKTDSHPGEWEKKRKREKKE